jgi:hypothetical protein
VKLSLTKFIYNNSKYSIIGISLFYILYRFYPNIEFYIKDNILEGGVLIVYKRIQRIKIK